MSAAKEQLSKDKCITQMEWPEFNRKLNLGIWLSLEAPLISGQW
jgi:hypothetical protein